MFPSSTTNAAREYLANEVALRARHTTPEEVRVTCSFARAERLLGREYHGRFLIELLQNAADAWRNDPRSASARSRAVVMITDGPALLVANQGAPMTAAVVIESLGHIGASTKAQGEAIGHKGIGFKSVLEVTPAPEIYSGLQWNEPSLAVAFDPMKAAQAIRTASPDWDALVSHVPGLEADDPLSAIPVLRFPYWVDRIPEDVAALAAEGFDTVIRLPFVADPTARRLSRGAWLDVVRSALQDASDTILLLLGCFSDVRVQDQLSGATTSVRVEWHGADDDVANGSVQHEPVHILRNEVLSSRWRLFRRSLSDLDQLAGEIAVGVRLAADGDRSIFVGAIDEAPAAPFHLFFPTRIPSGMPFLLHGYFEVDAGRTGFYQGSMPLNQHLLDELATLAVEAIASVIAAGDADLVSLVNLVAQAGEPEDPLAHRFRERVLDLLDHVPWIPMQGEHGSEGERPSHVVTGRSKIVRLIGQAFPPSYVRRRTGLGLPDARLSERAFELLDARRPEAADDLWTVTGTLCRPGDEPIWEGHDGDQGFRGLLDLLTALQGEDRAATEELMEGLRGDPTSRLLPTLAPDGGRRFLPIPNPAEGVAGQRSTLVLARARSAHASAVPPPEELDLAFLPPGLLDSESEVDRAKPLGVRAFTVDNILDRLKGIEATPVDPASLLRFVWHLLASERVTSFGTRQAREEASVFEPHKWFWCRPDRTRAGDTERPRQLRERYLTQVKLPTRDGGWRAAGELSFGSDWAAWLGSGAAGRPNGDAIQARIKAYHALEAICPEPRAMLAAPDVVLAFLHDELIASPTTDDDGSDDEVQLGAEQHAFLLRLGVWEVPPIEAFENQTPQDREPFPWQGPFEDRRREDIAADGGWRFGAENWKGKRHKNVYMAEDYRFQWSLVDAAGRNPEALLTGLHAGVELYAKRLLCHVFCPRCNDGSSRHYSRFRSSRGDAYPSTLALELRHCAWVPCTRVGDAPELRTPGDSWWEPHRPTGAALHQSPLKLLSLCGPSTGVTEAIRDLAHIRSLSTAGIAQLERLLADLRQRYESGLLPLAGSGPTSSRQPLIGLHRLAYGRLAALADRDPSGVAELLTRLEVLCELGDGLSYAPRSEARHDDGRFAMYIRHFKGDVPLVVLGRDQARVASGLDIAPFVVALERRETDDGRDVTAEVASMLGDRIAELLAIMVHHSLGSQTLEVTSDQFAARARRLQSLNVRQMDDLVVDARVEGSGRNVVLGEGSDQDLFLEGPSTNAPVLYHDLSGEGWQDRLRRKIAPHLAVVLENAAYAHTFALFLQAEGDAEREEFLLELGISGDDVEAIAARIGAVTEAEKRRQARWFNAVLATLGTTGNVSELGLDATEMERALVAAGLSQEVARALAQHGGGESARRDHGPDCPLRRLAASGMDLSRLHARLLDLGDGGLELSAARHLLNQWLERNRRRLVAVLATARSAEEAKRAAAGISPPQALAFVLDPPLAQVLSPVADLLEVHGIHADPTALAHDPDAELTRLGGFASIDDLSRHVMAIYDPEEQRRVLRERASQWRREIALLAVLSRCGFAESRARMRAMHDEVMAAQPPGATRPTELRDAVAALFSGHASLAVDLGAMLEDSILAPGPRREELRELAALHGLPVDRLASVVAAIDAQAKDRARNLAARATQLAGQGVRPAAPSGLPVQPPPPPRPVDGKPRQVATIKVTEQLNRRKKEMGDEGEEWALAALLDALMALSDDERSAAIDEMVALLKNFEGVVVDKVAQHAVLAQRAEAEDDERREALADFMHAAKLSDGFGFDMIGWLPPSDGMPAQAMCIEVKSSTNASFHLSAGEWAVAEHLFDGEQGDRYAVLVVRRGAKTGVPRRMDLLVNPITLERTGVLHMKVDGHVVTYGG